MSDSTESQRIIAFLANLAHFQGGRIDEHLYAAQRITDGTYFILHPDAEGQENGLLIAHWQADPERKAVVMGTQIAEHEIITAVKHWVTTGDMEDERASIEHLFQHFYHKTGARLSFTAENKEFSNTLNRLLKDVGWSAFKKFIGL